MDQLRAARDRASGVDLVELRLDGVRDLDVPGAIAGCQLPVVVTCRPTWEGGRFDGGEEARRDILRQALVAGAAMVDVEWRAGFDEILAIDPARVVLSMHDFSGVPADLPDIARAMRASGAGHIKIAVTAHRLCDTLPLLPIARVGRAVVIGMGEAGVPSRLLAARYGSAWSYAGDGVAPGQLPAHRMLDLFRFRQVGAGTRIFGVVSTQAMHSLSPVLHNTAFAEAGLDAVYVPLQAADFEDVLAYADAMGIEGASVTVPFKIDALRAAAMADDRTRRVGAANTLRRHGSAWEATNTDLDGFLDPLDCAWGGTVSGRRAAVLGAGGSARAIVAALIGCGVRVTVYARRAEQAASLVDALRDDADAGAVAVGEWPPSPGSWDLLVNCTPLGGGPRRDQSPVPPAMLDSTGGGDRLVYDLTYGAGESRLLRDARHAGCLVLDGLPMLVAQAERQYHWWMGRRPAMGVMAAALAAYRDGERRGDPGGMTR